MTEPLPFSTLKIRPIQPKDGSQPFPEPNLMAFELDGKPLPPDIIAIDIHIGVDSLVKATITFECLVDIDIPVEIEKTTGSASVSARL